MSYKTLLSLPLIIALACCKHAEPKKAEPPKPAPEKSLEEQLTEGLPVDNGLIAADKCGGAHWDPKRLPLKVFLDPSTSEWSGIMYEGLRWWGGSLFQVWDYKPLEEAIARGDADISALIPDMLITTDPYMFGQALTQLDIDLKTCEIKSAMIVMPELPMAPGFHMFIHELGHALGLDHDNDKESIMYPTVQGAHLPPQDRERLREKYGVPFLAYP